MKVIAGAHKGKYLKINKTHIRPTLGIVRGAIFNILGQRIHNAQILDIFAGTGALGIEALSRGAIQCVFIEKHPKILIKNIKELGLQDKVRVIKQDFRAGLKRLQGAQFDIIFIDPPYKRDYLFKTLGLIIYYGLIANKGIIVAEHSRFNRLRLPEDFIILQERRYGDTLISFLTIKKE